MLPHMHAVCLAVNALFVTILRRYHSNAHEKVLLAKRRYKVKLAPWKALVP